MGAGSTGQIVRAPRHRGRSLRVSPFVCVSFRAYVPSVCILHVYVPPPQCLVFSVCIVEPGVDVWSFSCFFHLWSWRGRRAFSRAKFQKERGRGWKGIWHCGRVIWSQRTCAREWRNLRPEFRLKLHFLCLRFSYYKSSPPSLLDWKSNNSSPPKSEPTLSVCPLGMYTLLYVSFLSP